ncbi:helix-turn-helix domain-containing protein [Alicyclobacillus fastidiosus]|uniref:Helix-turn-helix domain-containing protein n=1 Tax=Alicyclobacillus fastidiosus TaxID=392011 RepID=A0ABY6ZEQ4_9BACL|nr:helix-turn-helix domain-containing protein [Alicyclobacillus fastidiosus]WAH40716.1 helix-turn-helix domain-containing protein [Alicyclobacillus fastidiosus]GMA62188.1 hypothetical protein GCM10025859_26280 [Alicyclobacillus fastidiosus]
MFSYGPLVATLHRKHMVKIDLKEAIGISSATLAKIGRDEYVSMEVLDKICTYLQCQVEDVIEHINDDSIDSEVVE